MIFKFFEEITKIPRPSHHEEKIAAYLMDFAKERGLEAKKDEFLNVIIKKPAGPGREGDDPIILQAHTDMVCEKEPGVDKDFLTEGIDTVVENGWMRAKGTTLGADNGIGVAMILAVLDSGEISHPALECLFTATEETGLTGAQNIDLSGCKAKKMINLDSEEEGFFTNGCAGGADLRVYYKGKSESASGKVFSVEVTGLRGGHSGADIHLGRANANKILARVIEAASSFNYRIACIGGGRMGNAIPRDASALVVLPEDPAVQEAAINKMSSEAEAITGEYKNTDPELTVIITSAPPEEECLDSASSAALIKLISSLPNGVVGMTEYNPHLVETSLNLGIIHFDKGDAELVYHLRSSSKAKMDLLIDHMIEGAKEGGATYSLNGRYPAWEPNPHSPLCDRISSIYKEMTGKEPIVTVIHAGLECGILAEKIPGLDAVSLGPDMEGVHSPSERLNVESARRTFELVKRILG